MGRQRQPAVTAKRDAPSASPRQSDADGARPRTREQLVRQRAFELFEDRMRSGHVGDSDSDWTRAEREIDAQLSVSGPVAAAPPPRSARGGRTS